MSLTDEITVEIGNAFDELRSEFFPGSVAVLLKGNPNSWEYTDLLVLGGKWFFEDPTQFRSEFLFQVADNSDALETAMKTATHIRIDDDYYSIANQDPTRPKGTGVTWKLLCDRSTRKKGFSPVI